MDNTKAVIMDEMEVQDIDNLADWKLAELKYKSISSITAGLKYNSSCFIFSFL